MSLLQAYDAVIQYVDEWCPPQSPPSFDVPKFEDLAMALYVEARRYHLHNELPKADDPSCGHTISKVNMPGHWYGTSFSPLVTDRWRRLMSDFRRLAEATLAKRPTNASTKVALTDDDVYILRVLDAKPGMALTFRAILNQAVAMEKQDRTKMRRLSDSAIRKRAASLLKRGYVARPPETKKKGIAITEKGRGALRFASANSPQTHRKN
jgi:hypothetical protein